MKTINLKKYYYPLYETDTFIELSDEIADAIVEEWRTDHNSEQRLWSHTYSMPRCICQCQREAEEQRKAAEGRQRRMERIETMSDKIKRMLKNEIQQM